MNKRYRLVVCPWFILLGLCVIFTVVMDFHSVLKILDITFVCILLGYTIFLFIIISYENTQIKKNFKALEKDVDKLVEYCEKGVQKYCTAGAIFSCYLQMGVGYLLKNDIEKAKETLSNFNLNSPYKFSYYPNFILAILDNNSSKSNAFYKKLLACKAPVFNEQKDLATRILKMLETKVFDEILYEKTSYPCVKELCLKYKE